MAYSGSRLIFHSPLLTFRYIIRKVAEKFIKKIESRMEKVMFANLRLRSKMILGFSTALIIISVGLIFGIVGLLLNVSAFDDFTHLSNQLEMAKDIENELLESRLAYKHFMTAGDEGILKKASKNLRLDLR